jgi:hypothetical protein
LLFHKFGDITYTGNGNNIHNGYIPSASLSGTKTTMIQGIKIPVHIWSEVPSIGRKTAPSYGVGQQIITITQEIIKERMYQPRKLPLEYHPDVWNGQKDEILSAES